MTLQFPGSNSKLDKAMSPDQFDQVVEAILAGKYSWACVLILRFAGYNPLHYIPYRTYNRLLKENCQLGKATRQRTDSIKTENQSSESKSDSPEAQGCLGRISDLDYLEVVREQQTQVKGGTFEQWLDDKAQAYSALKVVLLKIN